MAVGFWLGMIDSVAGFKLKDEADDLERHITFYQNIYVLKGYKKQSQVQNLLKYLFKKNLKLNISTEVVQF